MRYLVSTIIALLATTLLNANSVEEGKEHYMEAKCQKCHLSGDKFDPNSINKEGLASKVKNKKDIKTWVANCDNFLNIGWFPEEQAKVAEYLNSSHYKLKE
ncbi:MAG TPA: hypothetical protein ENL00_00320 [Nitratifractor sp.]|nr:hypothetical protein [Nitratifractor sp.]HHD74258.1 hypothetical protein [Nitratifractor sp.]